MTPQNEQYERAVSVAKRARAGDQNAMGMIEQIRINAQGGNQLAQSSHGMISNWLKENPAEGAPVRFSGEVASSLGMLKDPEIEPEVLLGILCGLPLSGDMKAIDAAICLLSFGHPVNTKRIGVIQSAIPTPLKPAFDFGLANASDARQLTPLGSRLSPVEIGHLCAGHTLGTARRIQLARAPGQSVNILGADIGWEMGC
jgi:hypothetical protein